MENEADRSAKNVECGMWSYHACTAQCSPFGKMAGAWSKAWFNTRESAGETKPWGEEYCPSFIAGKVGCSTNQKGLNRKIAGMADNVHNVYIVLIN